MVNDDEAMKEVQRRADRCWLGLERTIQDLQGVAEIPKEDMKILLDRRMKEIDAKAQAFKNGKRRKNLSWSITLSSSQG
jgi:hypothetical protein